MSNFVTHLHDVLEPFEVEDYYNNNNNNNNNNENNNYNYTDEEELKAEDELIPIITQNVHELLSNGHSRHLMMDLLYIVEDLEVSSSSKDYFEVPAQIIKELTNIIKKNKSSLFLGELRSTDLMERLLRSFSSFPRLSLEGEHFIFNFLFLSFSAYPKLISLYCPNKNFLLNLGLKYFRLKEDSVGGSSTANGIGSGGSSFYKRSLWLLHSLLLGHDGSADCELEVDWIASFYAGFEEQVFSMDRKDLLIVLQCLQLISPPLPDLCLSYSSLISVLKLLDGVVDSSSAGSNGNGNDVAMTNCNVEKLKSSILALNILVELSTRISNILDADILELVEIFTLCSDDMMSLLLCMMFINLAEKNIALRRKFKGFKEFYLKIHHSMSGANEGWMYYGVLIGIIEEDSVICDDKLIARIKSSFDSLPFPPSPPSLSLQPLQSSIPSSQSALSPGIENEETRRFEQFYCKYI